MRSSQIEDPSGLVAPPHATHTQRGPFSQQALLDRRLHVPSIQYVGLIFLQSWLLASVACLEPAQRRRSKLVFPTERDIGALAGFMTRANFLMQPTTEKGSATKGGGGSGDQKRERVCRIVAVQRRSPRILGQERSLEFSSSSSALEVVFGS